MKAILITFVALTFLALGSCKKSKIEKSLNGTYYRTVPTDFQYSDSSTQILAKSNVIDYNREESSFAWGGEVTGRCDVETEKSDRSDNELELKLKSPNWSQMLPLGASPDVEYLNGCKFYLSEVSSGSVMLSIVNSSGQEVSYHFSKN